MSNSIELRLPFLEHKLVEYCLSLPKDIIFGDGKTKSILRKLMDNKMSNRQDLLQKFLNSLLRMNGLKVNHLKITLMI